MTTRMVGAAAAVLSAAIHLYLWFDGVKDQGTVGALFVVNVFAGVAMSLNALVTSLIVPVAVTLLMR